MTGAATHLRFVGGVVYCPAAAGRVRLGDDHRYGQAFTCPACGERVPARLVSGGRA